MERLEVVLKRRGRGAPGPGGGSPRRTRTDRSVFVDAAAVGRCRADKGYVTIVGGLTDVGTPSRTFLGKEKRKLLLENSCHHRGRRFVRDVELEAGAG